MLCNMIFTFAATQSESRCGLVATPGHNSRRRRLDFHLNRLAEFLCDLIKRSRESRDE